MLFIRTEDIYLSAGLDAVVLLKTVEFGIQFFVPVALVCVFVCTLHSQMALNCASIIHLSTGTLGFCYLFRFLRMHLCAADPTCPPGVSLKRVGTSWWVPFALLQLMLLRQGHAARSVDTPTFYENRL